MYTLLMFLTALLVLVFFGALYVYLNKIIDLLDAIGGLPASFLAKLRLGLRAIETETGHLGTLVPPLNQDLATIGKGLQSVDAHLTNTITAVVKQKRS